jgi:hypothetical protein
MTKLLARTVTLWSKSRRTHGPIYCLIWDSPNLDGKIPQEQGGPVILPGTGFELNFWWLLLTRPEPGPDRKHHTSLLYHVAVYRVIAQQQLLYTWFSYGPCLGPGMIHLDSPQTCISMHKSMLLYLPCYMARPSHPPRLDGTKYVWNNKAYATLISYNLWLLQTWWDIMKPGFEFLRMCELCSSSLPTVKVM